MSTDRALEAAGRLIATYQFEASRVDGEHAQEIVDVARALIALSEEVERKWHPIEEYQRSHPAYDGIVLLAWGDRVVPGRWVSNAGYQGFQPLSMIARKWDEPVQPTRFMPLPTPPSSQPGNSEQ